MRILWQKKISLINMIDKIYNNYIKYNKYIKYDINNVIILILYLNSSYLYYL